MLSAAQPARFIPTRKRPSIWLLLPVLLLVGLSLLPLLYVGTKAWQAGWSEALHLLWRPYVFGLMRNTLLLMVGVTVTCAVVGLSLAWLLERSNLQGRRLWGVILCLPFAVPAFVSSFTWVSLSASFEGLGGAILVMSLSKYPLIFLPVAATLRNLDPALEESARTLGQNRWGVFYNITLPLLWPSLLAGSLLIEVYASEHPQVNCLSLDFKQRVYANQLDLDELDPYVVVYRRIERYLEGRGEAQRLELVRRSLYLKVDHALSNGEAGTQWQRRLLKRLTREWGWDEQHLALLDHRSQWQAQQVSHERRALARELSASYRSLRQFARDGQVPAQ